MATSAGAVIYKADRGHGKGEMFAVGFVSIRRNRTTWRLIVALLALRHCGKIRGPFWRHYPMAGGIAACTKICGDYIGIDRKTHPLAVRACTDIHGHIDIKVHMAEALRAVDHLGRNIAVA